MNTKLIIGISILFLFLTMASVSAGENSTDFKTADDLPLSDAEDDVNASKINTRIIPDDIEGEEGDAVYASFDIVDERGNPVMNGTATLKMGDKNYLGEVSNGSVLFKAVIIEKGISKATIFYHGNEYYNSSETDIDVYLIEESYMDIPIYDDEAFIGTALYDEPSYSSDKSISTVKAISDSRQTGNPIFVMLLSLIVIASSGIIARKR